MAKQEIQVTGIDALNTEVRNAIELNKKNTVVNPNLAKQILTLLNQNPPSEVIEVNKMANDSLFVPISYVENTLDELFYGTWQTQNYRTYVVGNEIVGDIELKYYAPWIDEYIVRTGSASVQIQMDSGLKDEFGNQIYENRKKVKDPNFKITDFDKKIANTLVKDYPHLKSECIKNAARSIGKIFGRDLNRKLEDTYNPLNSMEERIEANNPRYIDKETIQSIEKQFLSIGATKDQQKYVMKMNNIQSLEYLLENQFEKFQTDIEILADKIKAHREKSNG